MACEVFEAQVTLLVRVLPYIGAETCFALKGGTAINLFVRLEVTGNPVIEFNAEFEDSEDCKLFRYSANSWKVRRATGEYNDSFTPIPPSE
jgi:hypothetical protein